MNKIKVLIVDDSALMRKYLRQILEEDAAYEVFTSRDGQDALEQIPKVDPDVVTMDINMPVMDGLSCLSEIMDRFPRPVVMVSSLTDKGALATFEAMALGAVDYVSKPGGTVSLNIAEVGQEIREKVRTAAGSRVRRSQGLRARILKQQKTIGKKGWRPAGQKTAQIRGLVLIGVSTGGPSTLEEILSALPGDFSWPILVAQHMPGRFTGVFADRLNNRCSLQVREVSGPTPIEPGTIYIGKGDADLIVGKRGSALHALCVPQDSSLWHPSVDRLVASAMEHLQGRRLIGVQLTGMGYDGAKNMALLHQKGGRTIAESEESSVVFGMPKELIERGGADIILPSSEVAAQLRQWA